MYIKLTLVLLTFSLISAEDAWTGKWFPNNPDEQPAVDNKTSSKEKWTGKWFPSNPNGEESKSSSSSSEQKVDSKATTAEAKKQWSGKWFPENPESTSDATSEAKKVIETDYKESTFERDRIMGIANSECDDGETNLHTDFDPSSADHAKVYTCLETNYKPNANLEPIETIYDVPKYYTPVHKCMNETITYDQHIPTLGYHRPLWPMFGEYTYVPPQRWLHSLEHGAIVMLYDPCAMRSEVDKLQSLLKKCLYRHVITPFKLSPERPLALVAWAVSLEMSVYDESTAREFIKKYAKSGPEKVSRQGQYKKMLIERARVLSDEDDSEICPDKSTVM